MKQHGFLVSFFPLVCQERGQWAIMSIKKIKGYEDFLECEDCLAKLLKKHPIYVVPGQQLSVWRLLLEKDISCIIILQ